MIIAFSGVDCAGKSTQIELLRQYFISQGKTCCVFWYRPGYSNEMQKIKDIVRPFFHIAQKPRALFKKLRNAVSSSEQKTSSSSEKSTQNKSPSIPAPLWLTTAILDTTAQYALKLRLLAKKYDIVICDRYIGDACLDLSFKYPEYSFSEDILRLIAKSFPKPDASILLMLPYDEMIRRVEAKNEPFPDSPQVRKVRWHAYQFIADNEDVTAIESTGTVQETHQKIVDAVSNLV